MNYFIVNAIAIINGANSYPCKVGSTSPSNDYKPNIIKQHIKESFSKKYNTNKIAIVINDVVQVNSQDYLKESENFLNF